MLENPYFLFVDDDRDDVEVACWRLSKAGIEVRPRIVESEPALRQELMQSTPDLIVSDFTMPVFDGWGALRIAKALAPDIPFVFHSGSIGPERCRTALERGAYGCVEKNHSAEFIQLVKQALSATQQ
jgi:CheY-like chemotaxis protein